MPGDRNTATTEAWDCGRRNDYKKQRYTFMTQLCCIFFSFQFTEFIYIHHPKLYFYGSLLDFSLYLTHRITLKNNKCSIRVLSSRRSCYGAIVMKLKTKHCICLKDSNASSGDLGSRFNLSILVKITQNFAEWYTFGKLCRHSCWISFPHILGLVWS